MCLEHYYLDVVAYPGIFSGGGGGSSTNSVEDGGQGSEGGSPLLRDCGAAVIWSKKFHFI